MLLPSPPLANIARWMRATTACLARVGMPVAHLATGLTRLAKRAVNDIACGACVSTREGARVTSWGCLGGINPLIGKTTCTIR